MAADDLEFGWYKWANGLRQRDGFFVDRAGNVLYWPSRKGPGFLLDSSEIPYLHTTLQKAGPLFSWRLVFWCMAAVYLLFERWVARYWFPAPKGDLPYILVWCAAAAVLLGVWLIQRPRWQDLELWSRPKMTGSRPPVRDILIVAKALSDGAFWRRIGLVAALASVCGFVAVDGIGQAVTGEPSALFRVTTPLLGAMRALFGIFSALYALSYLAALLWARSSSFTLAELVSRIMVREDLTPAALRRETDSEMSAEAERQFEARRKAVHDALEKGPWI